MINDEKSIVANNTPLVTAFCPIDGTQLVAVNEYDFSNYSCVSCGATYFYGDIKTQSLRDQARRYIERVDEHRIVQQNGLTNLERIVQAARTNGVI